MANLVDATIPQNSESPTLGAQRIRETRSGFNTLLGVEHDISDDATTKGYHGPNITIPEQASISDPGSNRGRLGVVEVAGVAELHYRDDASGTKQITNAGQLNIVDADGAVVKTGAQTIAGVKTFSDSPIVPTPTTNTQAANKNYVDTQVGAITPWNPSGTQIYSADAPTSYTDLDIATLASITAQGMLAILEVKNNDANANVDFFFRPNGSTAANDADAQYARGCAATRLSAGKSAFITIPTDSSGIVEWICLTSGVATIVNLVGYIA